MIALLLVVCGGVAPESLDSDVSSSNRSTRHGGSFIVKAELLFVLLSFTTGTAWK